MKLKVCCSEQYAAYFRNLRASLDDLIRVTNEAKSRGFDPKTNLHDEIRLSEDIADRVEYMVGPPGVASRIRELKHLPRIPLAFKVAEEIVLGAFGNLDAKAAAEQAVKTGIAILNEGVTAAALQGIVKVDLKHRREPHGRPGPERYLGVYFAGPMRSAGGTELAIVAVLADYVRRLLGVDAYNATENEIARFMEELRLYEREVGRFQFHVSDETIAEVLSHLPVEITGIGTDPVEVASYRNIPAIETNCVRGGALRVVNDGIAGRAPKVWKAIREMGLTGWDWLKNLTKPKITGDESESSYLHEIIAGRPVFSFPSTSKVSGRFRLRYGRARNTGLACVGVHPATMAALDDFIAVGTQLRLEMPGKAGIASPVDTIQPPIVKLDDGSLVVVESVDEARRLRGRVDRILFLGDLLVAYAEFLENGKPLLPSSYTEEWWNWDVKRALRLRQESKLAPDAASIPGIPEERFQYLMGDFLREKPTAVEALQISRFLKVPLHPKYSYFWKNISLDEFQVLRSQLSKARFERNGEFVSKIFFSTDLEAKRVLEKLLIPHHVEGGEVVITAHASTVASCLRLDGSLQEFDETHNILQLVSKLAGVDVRDNYACFIGSRMGRPEKSDARKMKPPVHSLFPIGLSGGSQRNILEASSRVTEVEVVARKCLKCGKATYENLCPSCGERTTLESVCPKCNRPTSDRKCPSCHIDAKYYARQVVGVKDRLSKACSSLGVSPPDFLKGVKGLMNEKKTPEPLEKGILRARHGLWVFKDGTIRYDLTNAPLTHFKPAEVGISVEDTVKLGYAYDKDGKPLTSQDQTCELKVQDIIISEKCAEYLARVTRFIDELLSRLYRLPPDYNVSTRDGLLGHLVVGLSPHTSAGVVGRIAGFSKLNVCYSHPLWISAKRRDCDGDEDAVMMAMDTFLNFSTDYVPAQIGGIMDAPLLLTPVIDPMEVDDQVWTLDLSANYPPDFYTKTLEGVDSKLVKDIVDSVSFRLGTAAQFEGYGFLHDVANINAAPADNLYKRLKTMRDKLMNQMTLVGRIEGVDAREVAKKVLNVHFMRDIMGNLKVFATQAFRCKRCNQKYRRIPLKGSCLRCGGQLSLTVYEGSVEKYLEVADWIARTYGLEDYYAQRISLASDEISYLFTNKTGIDKEKEKDMDLTEFM
ncbi:MAG: DNA polymerase II large subunit [Candidatus Bathyarchaeia archaeon]